MPTKRRPTDRPSKSVSHSPSVRLSIVFPKTSIPLCSCGEEPKEGREREEVSSSSHRRRRRRPRSDFTSTSVYPSVRNLVPSSSRTLFRERASASASMSACLSAFLTEYLFVPPYLPLRSCEAFDLSAPNRFVFSAYQRTNELRTNERSHSHRTIR